MMITRYYYFPFYSDHTVKDETFVYYSCEYMKDQILELV